MKHVNNLLCYNEKSINIFSFYYETVAGQLMNGKHCFCNIINVFTDTFDQFNASLLNKSKNFLKKKRFTDPKHLIGSVYLYLFKTFCSLRFHGAPQWFLS